MGCSPAYWTNTGDAYCGARSVTRPENVMASTPPPLNRSRLPAFGVRMKIGSGPLLSTVTVHGQSDCVTAALTCLSWSSLHSDSRVLPATNDTTIRGADFVGIGIGLLCVFPI